MASVSLSPAMGAKAMLMHVAPVTTQPAAEPSFATGASVLWTSIEPGMARARELVLAGKLAEAASLLSDGSAASNEALEIIRRIRREYSLNADDLLVKLRTRIKKATAEDVQRWTENRALQWREIDGEVCYFRSEPRNLILHTPEAKALATAPQKKEFDLERHLKRVIEDANKGDEIFVQPVRQRVTCRMVLEANRPGLKPGMWVRVWMPFPQELARQRDVQIVRTSPEVTLSAVDGSAHRTLFFERAVEDPTKEMVFEAVYEFTGYSQYVKLDESKVTKLPADFNQGWLAERPPHIVFSPRVRETVAKIVGEETNPLVKARLIFHWVDKNVPWCSEQEYSIIPSFTEQALEAGRGDCGLQNTTFVTLCRAAGIPARWQSGWQTKPGEVNLHDWSEIYIAPYGWLPSDASWGVQKSDDPRIADFYLGHMESFRMVVNTDYGQPLVPAKRHFRSEPADFQRGEMECEARNFYFDEWSCDLKVEYLK